MESTRGFTTLRCRRCRKNYIDSTCLNLVSSSEERPSAQCSVWHVNVDALPKGMLAAIQQAQWTVGKLHCGNCSARLGGFNFVNRSRCPCGQSVTVHLSKSRVDQDQALPLQPSLPPRCPPATVPAGCDVMSCIASATQATPTSAQASPSSSSCLRLLDGDAGQTLRCCVPHRTAQRRLQAPVADAQPTSSSSSSTSALVTSAPAGRPAPRSALALHRGADAGEPPPSPVAPPPPPPLSGPEGPQSPPPPPQDRPGVVSGAVVSAPVDEAPDSPMFLRGRTITDSIGEPGPGPEASPQPQPSVPVLAAAAALSRLSKREKNRLKSNRRKQRKRERWIHSLQEQSLLLTDSEEEDREGFTCAVCLDVYYCPYSCHPCGHVFCEPCLRTLARSRPSHTPCPLCRTLIAHTLFQKELNETTESFFPKVFSARKHNFQRAPCSRWPLPSGPKRFHIFWGYQRQPAEPGRRWPLGPAGFTLDALDLADMRGWLFDVDLVIIYIHSVNWILAFLLLVFLLYFFFS